MHRPQRQTLTPVLNQGGPSTITIAGTCTTTTGFIISPDIENFLTVEELAAVAAGERELAAGEFVTLDNLEQAADD